MDGWTSKRVCVLMLIHSEEFTEEALQVLLAVITGGTNFMPHRTHDTGAKLRVQTPMMAERKMKAMKMKRMTKTKKTRS